MTLTLRAILDFPSGSSIGIRAYKDSAPNTQHGSDIILAQDDTRNNLYEAPGVNLDASTQYTVDIYTAADDANIDAGGYFAASPLYVGADGGTYFVGGETSGGDATLENQTDILSRLSGGSGETLASVLTGGRIQLKIGDDQTVTAGKPIQLQQPDAGGVLYAEFSQEGITARICGFRRKGSVGRASDIVATIPDGEAGISHTDGVTTFVIEAPAAVKAGQAPGEFEYDLKYVLNGEAVAPLWGPADLIVERAATP